jgi:hypothetical protein
MPSASDMMREMRAPVCVESKKRTGSRATCACTRLRISVMARCAATPSTCESANEVNACTAVAAPAASAMVVNSSARPFVMTSSMRYLELAGRTRPTSRLTSISAIPSASRWRCAQINSLASRHASDARGRFFFFSSDTFSAPLAALTPRVAPVLVF